MTDTSVLDEIKATLRLDNAELARLVREDESVIASWNGSGVPSSHEDRVAPLVFVVQFMNEWYVEPLIPALVRKPLRELGDRSVLDTLADDPNRVISYLSGLFNFPDLNEI